MQEAWRPPRPAWPGIGRPAGWLADEKKSKLYCEDLKLVFQYRFKNSQERLDLVQVLFTLYENDNFRGISILVQGESSGTPFLLNDSHILTTYLCTSLEILEEFLISYNVRPTSTK